LKTLKNLSVEDYLKLNTRYGHYLATCVNQFIETHSLHHQIDFVASHGHTAFHDPQHQTSVALGCGATLAAHTQLPVISDLRAMDVALGGQGAPIVPIGDKLLFAEYDYWLNIGGIVNITSQTAEKFQAFDVCPGNQLLNILAQREGKEMDENGDFAKQGQFLPDIFEALNAQNYYQREPPKSLSNEAAQQLVFPILLESAHRTIDLLHTAVQHIATQVANVVNEGAPKKLLVTGGGAFNAYLIEVLKNKLVAKNVEVIVPDATIIKFKEALVMALIGALRWREEVNVLAPVTGAKHNSIGGAFWMGRN
jgi:anhydro-N-acetylmuramic acid kinase